MADLYSDAPVITDRNCRKMGAPLKGYATGLIPRNFSAYPVGYLAAAAPMPESELIPEDQWETLLGQQKEAKASLLDLREANYDLLQSLSQLQWPYCWAFSTTKSMMYCRAVANEPPVKLSAWMIGAIIKNYQKQGGWCSESLAFAAKYGCASLEEWPQGQVKRSLDTPEMRAKAVKRRVTEWWDGSDNRDLARRQMVSAFLKGDAPVLDYNWQAHSVCGAALVSVNPLRVAIDNSWGEEAGDRGIYVYEGNKAIPDAMVIPRVASPSP